MARFTQKILANTPTLLPVGGKFVQIVDTGNVTTVNVSIAWNPGNNEDFGAAQNNWRIGSAVPFYGVQLTATADTTIDIAITNVDVTIVGGRGSSPGFPMYVSGALLGDTPAAGATYGGPAIAVTDVSSIFQAANVNRLEARIRNTGANPVAIGFVGMTFSDAAIVLQPNDVWIETKGAALEMHCVCSAGLTSTINTEWMHA